jgi:hypothetical protein
VPKIYRTPGNLRSDNDNKSEGDAEEGNRLGEEFLDDRAKTAIGIRSDSSLHKGKMKELKKPRGYDYY